jgi:hypothetical protein
MFNPTAMIMADRATRHHVLSAQPQAPTIREPSARHHPMRRLTAVTLRRLADRVEPSRAAASTA